LPGRGGTAADCYRMLLRAVLCMLLALPVFSAQAEERLTVRSAAMEESQGVLLLNADIDIALPDGARDAVRDGVELTFDIEVRLFRERSFWFDDAVATLAQRYELSFHALTERYLVRNRNSGAHSTHATLDEALDVLRNVQSLPVLDRSLLDPNERYEARLRASLDVHTLPGSLRVVLFWTDDWKQQSDWYAWPLEP
jgi:hypothetical protein